MGLTSCEMKTYRFIGLIVLYIICNPCFSQTILQVDSLKADLALCKSDTCKVTILAKLANGFYKISAFDSIISYANRGLDIARNLNDKKMIATYYTWLGVGNHFKGNSDIELENYLAALKINEEIGNKKSISVNLTNIGSIYYENKGDYGNALDYYSRSLFLKKELKDSAGISAVLINIGNIYTYKKEYEKAIYNITEAYKISLQTRNLDMQAKSISYLGNVYTLEKQFDKALSYRLKGLELGKQSGNKELQVNDYIGAGQALSGKKKYSEALHYYTVGLELAMQMNFKLAESNAYEGLTKASLGLGDHLAAFNYLQKFNEVKDSLQNSESNKRVDELLLKYGTEKKERAIQELGKKNAENELQLVKRRNEVFYLLGSSILVIMVLLLIYFRYRHVQSKQRVEKELELKNLKERQQQQLLHAIVRTEEDERRKLAGDLHDGLGQILTAAKMNLNMCLQNPASQEGTLKKQINTSIEMVSNALTESKNIASNLLPVTIKGRGLVSGIRDICDNNNLVNKDMKINLYTQDIPLALPQMVEINVFRICQELITNCIKHSKSSLADLQLFHRDEMLVIQMSDNGVGLDPLALKSNGLGIRNIQNRVELLAGEITVDSSPGKGCTFTFHISLQNTVDKND